MLAALHAPAGCHPAGSPEPGAADGGRQGQEGWMGAGEVFMVGVWNSSWFGAGAKVISQRWDLLGAALQVWVLAPDVGNLYSPGLAWCVFSPFLLLLLLG